MSIDDYKEIDIGDASAIDKFVASLENQERELVLSSKGNVVGAILTAEQYEWFLEQLDNNQDLEFISKRIDDRDGAQSLDDLKKEIEK
ncbi:MAG TPA: hypothetical protein ENJ08_07335 [Gammaproteobacteria bacterium]|nr:hypothetical protein [Gammaproteobacteria bacterium]